MHEVTLVPNAASLSQSMRDIGYSLETAIADLIDNSISAGAKIIHVVFDKAESSDPYLAVIDDGSGMTKDEALEAMRPVPVIRVQNVHLAILDVSDLV